MDYDKQKPFTLSKERQLRREMDNPASMQRLNAVQLLQSEQYAIAGSLIGTSSGVSRHVRKKSKSIVVGEEDTVGKTVISTCV